jgi:hypothetical protein
LSPRSFVPFLVVALVALVACAPATPPSTREFLELRGTPYERGLQHGTQLRSKIRSFYATLLTNSLFPYLGREQPDIASLLAEYDTERYQNGNFAFELMLDSAKSIERSLNRATREELQGIADGSGLTYDQVLVLNTFVDSVLAVRGVALAIRVARSPTIETLEFLGAAGDGADNDGDGETDEANEGLFEPYAPQLSGHAVELPVNASFRLVLSDADGVDPAAVRLLVNGQLYVQGSPELVMTELDATRLQVVVAPPALPAASVVTLVVSAGDKKLIEVPAPARASFMRDNEIVFTTRGAGLDRRDVRRPPLTDGRTRPPPVAIGVRGSRAADGAPLLAHHFSLLDANTAHKHTVVLRHVPDTGPAFVTVGWAGIVYGLSGVNERGVGYACNPSDTLDSSVVGSVLDSIVDITKAKLTAKGLPIGFVGRKVLAEATDAASARAIVTAQSHVYGWSCIVADDRGGLEAIEVDSDVFNSGDDGVFPFTPDDVDASGRRYASLTPDDLVLGSSFVKNVPDIATLTVAGQKIVPQSQWSGFFFRSRRVIHGVQQRLVDRAEPVDVPWLQALIADPQFVDQSDSMNAAVIDLKARRLHAAIGAVPATAMPFEATEVVP